MFESLKKIGAVAKGKAPRNPAAEMQDLLDAAREERVALNALLSQIEMRGSKVKEVGKSLEQVEKKAAAATERLETMTSRFSALDQRVKAADQLEQRIESLSLATTGARELVDDVTAPDGDLQKHREAVQTLSSQILLTQASVDTLKNEREVFEDLRAELRQVQADVKQSVEQTATVKGDFDQMRVLSSQLAQDYSKIRDASREGHERAAGAMETVKDIEKKLGPLAELQELSKGTEDRLASLRALAEHVSLRAKALENQKHTIEHAVVEASRLNEMVWAMDAQINKLNEGQKQMARAEEMLARVEKLSGETGAQLEAATAAREAFGLDIARLEKTSHGAVEFGRTYLEQLTVQRKEAEVSDQRVRALQSLLAETEGRMDVLVAKDKALATLGQRIDALGARLLELDAQSEDLAARHLALESLGGKLAQVDELSKRTVAQMEALAHSRRDVDVLQKEVQAFYKSFADVAQTRDRLTADRAALEAFGDRMSAFGARMPELDAKLDAVLGKLGAVDDGTKKAARFDENMAEIDRQVGRIAARQPLVEKLETRINTLTTLSESVDRRLAEQLAHRAELDTLGTLLEGVSAQAGDAQQKLAAVTALQGRLLPLVDEATALKTEMETLHARYADLARDGATVAEQEKRLAELVDSSRGLMTDAAERMRELQGLSEALKHATAVKDELLTELARVQGRQREAVAQVGTTEDHVKRVETLYAQLENRRTQLAFSEKKIAAFESRIAELKQATDVVDGQIQAITSRDAIVAAIKAEVDAAHEIGAKTKADLEEVTASRESIATLKASVDDVLAHVGKTDEKIAHIESRRAMVDEAQVKVNLIVHMLDDVRVNLDTLEEQRAVVEDVAEKVARLDFVVQEAQNTLRTLRHERELAERIEQGIKQIRARTTPAAGGKKRA